MCYLSLMSRPLRIEFPGAWYHVMNRGAARRNVFKRNGHRLLFLDLLGDLLRMFHVEAHAYCLMDNHYHLLMHTPGGNLQRAMRHLNGVYTQRHNRLERTDGPLFRGRYKAILVDADAYLLSVSRYIHLNPVEAGVVKTPSEYPWSSYPAYIGLAEEPAWLHTDQSLRMIGQRRVRERYRAFVESGVDGETARFYGTKKVGPILGGDAFRKRVLRGRTGDGEVPEARRLRPVPGLPEIVAAVAQVFGVERETIMTASRGRGAKNPARAMALYVSRKVVGAPLNEIAGYFGLRHYGSVSGVVSRVQQTLSSDPAAMRRVRRIDKIINEQI
jgi:REP element-mobilizing transposase RayT